LPGAGYWSWAARGPAMASDDSSGARPASPIVLRIKLRYDDVEAMIQRFAANVGKSGLFLPTRSLQPIGAEIKFELRLSDDTPVLVGLGRVKAARAPDPQHPRAAFGMAIELMRVTPQSRALILRMLDRRRETGLPELGLPMASDIDAARRAEAAESGGRDLASGPIAVVAPVAPPLAPASASSSGSIDLPPGEALMTAPRRTTVPMVAAKVLAIAPLGPEAPRRRRMAVSEILESASGPIASVSAAVPGLDDDVDIAATLARARALAGTGLDAELDALCEIAAAPLEISIEAASAELARQLGGHAVRRDRSGGWAPPPATRVHAAGTEAAPVVVEAPEPGEPAPAAAEVRAADEAAPGDAPNEAGARAANDAALDVRLRAADDAAPEAGVPAAAEAAFEAGLLAADEAVPQDEAVPLVPEPRAGSSGAVPVAITDGEADSAESEWRAAGMATEMAAEPPPADEPPPNAAPDAQDPGDDADGESAAPAFSLSDDSGVVAALAELDADEHTEMGDMPAGGGFEPVRDADLELRERDTPQVEPPLELGVDEFDDFEILAEADADDADLLAAHGEHDASNRRELHPRPGPQRRVSELDFAARLDLGDDNDPYALPSDEFSAHHVIDSLNDELTGQHLAAAPRGDRRMLDPLHASAGAALAMFETGDEPIDDPLDDPGDSDRFDARRIVQPIFEPDPSSSFTLAGVPSDSIDLDVTPAPIEPARPARRPAAASRPEPAVLRSAPLSLHEAPVEDHELEHALEALDVDLDDLSIPHAATQLQRDPSRPTAAPRTAAVSRTPGPQPRVTAPTPAPQPRAAATTPSRAVHQAGHVPGSGRVVAPRAPSDDGVDVDFDDDD